MAQSRAEKSTTRSDISIPSGLVSERISQLQPSSRPHRPSGPVDNGSVAASEPTQCGRTMDRYPTNSAQPDWGRELSDGLLGSGMAPLRSAEGRLPSSYAPGSLSSAGVARTENPPEASDVSGPYDVSSSHDRPGSGRAAGPRRGYGGDMAEPTAQCLSCGLLFPRVCFRCGRDGCRTCAAMSPSGPEQPADVPTFTVTRVHSVSGAEQDDAASSHASTVVPGDSPRPLFARPSDCVPRTTDLARPVAGRAPFSRPALRAVPSNTQPAVPHDLPYIDATPPLAVRMHSLSSELERPASGALTPKGRGGAAVRAPVASWQPARDDGSDSCVFKTPDGAMGPAVSGVEVTGLTIMVHVHGKGDFVVQTELDGG